MFRVCEVAATSRSNPTAGDMEVNPAPRSLRYPVQRLSGAISAASGAMYMPLGYIPGA